MDTYTKIDAIIYYGNQLIFPKYSPSASTWNKTIIMNKNGRSSWNELAIALTYQTFLLKKVYFLLKVPFL